MRPLKLSESIAVVFLVDALGELMMRRIFYVLAAMLAILAGGCGYGVEVRKPLTPLQKHLRQVFRDPRVDIRNMWFDTDENNPTEGRVVLTPSESMTAGTCQEIVSDWSKRSINAGFNVTYHVEPLWAGVADLREEIARGKEAESRLAKLLELHGKTEADFPVNPRQSQQ